MSRTGIITTYLVLRLLVEGGFINIYPAYAPKCRTRLDALKPDWYPVVGAQAVSRALRRRNLGPHHS
jgi:hypothetical protein